MAVINLSGLYNPYTELMTKLGEIVNNIVVPYYLSKDLIDQLSDTELRDQVDKIRELYPDAVKEDGTIDWKKIEQLSSTDKYAKHILQVRKNREEFRKFGAIKKLSVIQDPSTVQSAYTITISKEEIDKLNQRTRYLEEMSKNNPIIKLLCDSYGGCSNVAKNISDHQLFQLSLLSTIQPNQQQSSQPSSQQQNVFSYTPQYGLENTVQNSFDTPTIKVNQNPQQVRKQGGMKSSKKQQSSKVKPDWFGGQSVDPNWFLNLQPTDNKKQSNKVPFYDYKTNSYKTIPSIVDLIFGGE